MEPLHTKHNDQPAWFAGILAAMVLLMLYAFVY